MIGIKSIKPQELEKLVSLTLGSWLTNVSRFLSTVRMVYYTVKPTVSVVSFLKIFLIVFRAKESFAYIR